MEISGFVSGSKELSVTIFSVIIVHIYIYIYTQVIRKHMIYFAHIICNLYNIQFILLQHFSM